MDFVANLVYSKVGTDCEISTNCNSCYLSNVPNRGDCEVGTLFLKTSLTDDGWNESRNKHLACLRV